jgi:hypothetical protein
MNSAETAILQVIESWGLQCTRINESSSKSPDFFLADNHEHYFVELKAKYESPSRAKDRQNCVGVAQVFSDSLELRGTAAYRSILKKAYKQLNAASRHDSEPLRIPWLLCLGLQASVDVERFINVLLGTAYIADFSDGGDAKPCYFFFESLFFKYRNTIDAAIVSTDTSISMCLNPYSQRYSRAKTCGLAGILETGLIDPCSLEMIGEAWIADMVGDREDTRAILDAVVKKYCLSHQTKVIEMEELSAAMVINAI